MIINIQEKYEDTLAFKLQTKRFLKELIDTNKKNSQLRLESIRQRKNTLLKIEEELKAYNFLFEFDIDFNSKDILMMNKLIDEIKIKAQK